MTPEAWTSELGRMLDERLEEGERASGLVSKLASGSAFESWLSFELRLLLEGWTRPRTTSPASMWQDTHNLV